LTTPNYLCCYLHNLPFAAAWTKSRSSNLQLKNLGTSCSSLTTQRKKQWLCQDIVTTASKLLRARLPFYSGTAACATLALIGLFSSANSVSLRPAGLAHIMPNPSYLHPLLSTKSLSTCVLIDGIPLAFSVPPYMPVNISYWTTRRNWS